MRQINGKLTLVAGAILIGSLALLAADETTGKVDKLFAAWDKTTSPGATLAVVRDGKIVYERGYGMAKLEDGIVNTPDKVFDIGSVSKQFTAACVAMLVREGKVGLEDDIRKYHARDARLREAGDGEPSPPSHQRAPRLQRPARAGRVPGGIGLAHGRGGRRESSGGRRSSTTRRATNIPTRTAGFFLLSQIVERVSGKSLNAFAQERIFKPLGMTKTLFQDDHTQIIKDRATGYTQGRGRLQDQYEQLGRDRRRQRLHDRAGPLSLGPGVLLRARSART